MDRLKILLVPDFLPWILGTWAQQISRLGLVHDYYLFSEQMILHYPDRWNALLEEVDVVHFLNHWEVKNRVVPETLTRVNTITHVTNIQEWEEQMVPLLQADAVVVIAQEWEQFLREQRLLAKKLHLCYIGVDPKRFYPVQNQAQSRRQLGINSASRLIGYSAKFTSNNSGRKGTDVFLEALKQCADSGYSFGVVITGPGWNQTIEELERYSIEVHYRPFLPDRLMPSFYNALDLFVCTARIEGGPAPVLESMACGIPVITTSVGTVKDHLKPNIDALIIPKNDAHACAQAMIRLLDSYQLRAQLSQSARKTVLEHLTWSKTLQDIESLYTQVWQTKTNTQHNAKSPPNGLSSSKAENQHNNWAIQVDSYLWHYQLFHQGYIAEGIRGMLSSSLKVGGRETFIFLRETLSILKLMIRCKVKKRLSDLIGSSQASSKPNS